MFRLADQITRATRSITANIADGFGRLHPQENLQFCRQARGSLMETLVHLNTALDEKLLSSSEYDALSEQWRRVRAILLGYIKYLQTLSTKDRKFTEKKLTRNPQPAT